MGFFFCEVTDGFCFTLRVPSQSEARLEVCISKQYLFVFSTVDARELGLLNQADN